MTIAPVKYEYPSIYSSYSYVPPIMPETTAERPVVGYRLPYNDPSRVSEWKSTHDLYEKYIFKHNVYEKV